ncbi:hypothetical protein [Streptomyces sp. NPDC003077]|uniref:hypothetical protein n=1 Tax=Streptomyces sp. NPDC003077 TaxID=3154443 RepID=UPI0033ADBAC7
MALIALVPPTRPHRSRLAGWPATRGAGHPTPGARRATDGTRHAEATAARETHGTWHATAGAPCSGPTARHRWYGRLLTLAGLALLPWMGYLAGTLPPAEAALWVALDSLEALCLLTAGVRLTTGRPGHRATAGVAAALLAADACVDVATSGPGAELLAALAMAAGAELPLAALCAVLATRRASCAGRG